MAEIWVPAECGHSQRHGCRPSLLHAPAKHEVLIANAHRGALGPRLAQPPSALGWGGYHTFALLSGLPSGVVPPPKTPAVLHVRSCDRRPLPLSTLPLRDH